MQEIRYPILIHDDPDGLTVEIPDFETVTEGDSIEECIQAAHDAIDGMIESHLDNGFPIPAPSLLEDENAHYVVPEPRLQAALLLRFTRLDLRLSQEELAKRLRIAQRTYSEMENLKRTNLTMKSLGKLAKEMGKQVVIRFEDAPAADKRSN